MTESVKGWKMLSWYSDWTKDACSGPALPVDCVEKSLRYEPVA